MRLISIFLRKKCIIGFIHNRLLMLKKYPMICLISFEGDRNDSDCRTLNMSLKFYLIKNIVSIRDERGMKNSRESPSQFPSFPEKMG